jgi:hypothetical protein
LGRISEAWPALAAPGTAFRARRFVYEHIPQSELDDTLAQVKRWGLDQLLKERDFGKLTAATG